MAWQPPYATAAELAGWLRIEADDAELALAIEAASRAIDKATGRQFGLTDYETRVFDATFYRGRWYVDDLPDLTAPIAIYAGDGPLPETIAVQHTLGPRNAPTEGRPWTRISFPASALPRGVVSIRAAWGWSAVPGAIKQATLIQAARFYDRRVNVSGPQTSKRVDDIALGWSVGGSAADLDPEVLSIVRPFRRLWVAV